jgi:hypothetical protein
MGGNDVSHHSVGVEAVEEVKRSQFRPFPLPKPRLLLPRREELDSEVGVALVKREVDDLVQDLKRLSLRLPLGPHPEIKETQELLGFPKDEGGLGTGLGRLEEKTLVKNQGEEG